MKLQERRNRLRMWGLVAMTAVATVVLAAAADPDASWARIKALPLDQRVKLLDSLHRFDLTISTEKQAELRSIDRKLLALDPAERSRYLETLERYHNWLTRLPDKLQEEIRGASPKDRMAVVRKIAANHPVPREDRSPPFLSLVDVGDLSPFDIAWIYKTWVKSTPAERAKLETYPVGKRRMELRKLAKAYDVSPEAKPSNFDEEKWTERLESRYYNTNTILYELLSAKKNEAMPTGKTEDWWKTEQTKREQRRREILKRQAVNLYFMDASHRSRPVDGDKLAQFVAALPPWIPPAFDQFAPDEARRRLSIVYRLVFANGEITAGTAVSKSGPGQGVPPKPDAAGNAVKKPAIGGDGQPAAPF